MKKCDICKIEKEDINFCKCKTAKDGLNKTCRSCASESARKTRQKHRERILKEKKDHYYKNQEYYKEKFKENYLNNREERIKKYREYSRTEEAKEKARVRNREFKKRKRELIAAKLLIEEDLKKRQRSAVDKVCYAVKTGKLIKPDNCEICGEINDLQGHHEDYAKPLEVKWLCFKCHCHMHNKLMDIQ